MDIELQRRKLELLKKRKKYRIENKLEFYDPYPFQVGFHNDDSDRVGLVASNQTGKTVAGTVQDAFDLTGLYPDWYEGYRFEKPIHLLCGGINNDKTRDLLQKALFGDPTEKESALGLGWVPKRCLDRKKISLKRGVSDAFLHVKVKHFTNGVHDGWSTCTFSSYESGKEAWMGDTIDIYHGDEECKMDIMAQMGRGCIASGGRIRMTFTPENGETDVLQKVKQEWSLHEATFADIAGESCSYTFDDGETLTLEPVYTMGGKLGHITAKTIENLSKDNPPWMMKTRMMGLPMIGEGLVFSYMENQFKIEPIEFPDYFKYIDAIDFGGLSSTSHPTAFVRAAYDPQNDVIYIYDGFRLVGKEIPEVAAHILMKPHSNIVPVIWPHDGNKTLGQGGPTKNQYLNVGVNMYNEYGDKSHFRNPPDEGKDELSGNYQILPGITEMSARFNDGRLKVFSTVGDFFEEYRKYHMKDGKIVDRHDDFMAATRYAVQSIRHAVTLEKKVIQINTNRAAGGWMGA